MAPNRRQAIIWTNGDMIRWHIYASPGGDELIKDVYIMLIEETSTLLNALREACLPLAFSFVKRITCQIETTNYVVNILKKWHADGSDQ